MANPEARSLRFYCSGRNAIALKMHRDFYHDVFNKEKGSSLIFLFLSYIGYTQFIRYGNSGFFILECIKFCVIDMHTLYIHIYKHSKTVCKGNL